LRVEDAGIIEIKPLLDYVISDEERVNQPHRKYSFLLVLYYSLQETKIAPWAILSAIKKERKRN